MYSKDKNPSFENIEHTEVVKESKSLNIICTEGIQIRLFPEFVVEFTTCGKMNGCFGTSVLYTSEDNVNLKLFTDFSRSNHYGTEWKRGSM